MTNTPWKNLHAAHRHALKLEARMFCRCGHRHDKHGPSQSINFTAGECRHVYPTGGECDCTGFVHDPNILASSSTPQPQAQGPEGT